MMKLLKFEGHSDDAFGEYETFKDDYDNCASGSSIVWKVTAGGDSIYVHGQYAGKGWPKACPGCWMVGVQPEEEDVPLPSWPMRFTDGESGYSACLVIEAPDDVKIKCMNLKACDDE